MSMSNFIKKNQIQNEIWNWFIDRRTSEWVSLVAKFKCKCSIVQSVSQFSTVESIMRLWSLVALLLLMEVQSFVIFPPPGSRWHVTLLTRQYAKPPPNPPSSKDIIPTSSTGKAGAGKSISARKKQKVAPLVPEFSRKVQASQIPSRYA